MLAEKVTFTPSHQPKHVKFVDTVQGRITSTPWRPQEEVALPSNLIFQNHPEEWGIHAAAYEFKKMEAKN